MLDKTIEDAYVAILQEELIPATGCTEPIAIAYAAATLTKMLGKKPEKILAEVSGNIVKNVKSVVVPNTGGQRGIEAAISAGVVAGDSSKHLQVISDISDEKKEEIKAYKESAPIEVSCIETPCLLDIKLTGWAGDDTAVIRIANNHSNIVFEQLNDEVLLEKPISDSPEDNLTDKSVLNVRDILEFAKTVDIDRIMPLVLPQIELNTAIAQEGLDGDWGANIGSVILSATGVQADAHRRMKAYAAAGSDARMSGCEMPVVILSGSGNQGITASVPVAIIAREWEASDEDLIRAVALSDLVAIEQKRGIGRLSAYCGAVSAGVGVAAAVSFLDGGDYRDLAHTIVNAVAIISGTICDGAKPSCAAKIAESIDAGILAHNMWKNQQQFLGGDGIVTKGVDETIANVGILAKEGMRQTDRIILEIMTKRDVHETV